jgi:hypothetical protein
MKSKLIAIERTINTYSNDEKDIVETTKMNVAEAQLKSIITPKSDDPKLYEGYVLNQMQLDQLQPFLTQKIAYNFDNYYYVAECYGIYE